MKKLTGSSKFGYAVTISETSSTIGCHGSAYVCYRNQRTSDNWGIVKKLLASDRAANDYFGTSLAISGTSMIVGATGHDGWGSAYVFVRDQGGADAWGQVKELVAGDAADGDHFGRSVAIDGDAVVVGAKFADACQGSAYLYNLNQGGAGNWGEVRELSNPGGDRFGSSVAIASDTTVVGAPGQSASLEWAGGSGVTFARSDGVWPPRDRHGGSRQQERRSPAGSAARCRSRAVCSSWARPLTPSARTPRMAPPASAVPDKARCAAPRRPPPYHHARHLRGILVAIPLDCRT